MYLAFLLTVISARLFWRTIASLGVRTLHGIKWSSQRLKKYILSIPLGTEELFKS